MLNPDIKLAVEKIDNKKTAYQKFYNYYDGLHTWNYSSKKFKDKYAQRLQTLRENLCKTVVKAPASRLEVIGFQAETQEITDVAWKIWKRGNLPLNAAKSHREAFKTGDSYAIVWADDMNRACVFPQLAANMTVWKNETGKITKAAKLWMENKFYYLTLYYPDRIEKYISKTENSTTDFVQRKVMGEIFPLSNTLNRVPVFHFTNDNELADFGTSLLMDVIPLNDALNKSLADIFVGQEYNSMRQRHIAGLRAEIDDETGKKINPFAPDDSVWIAEDETVNFGEFTDADIESMLKVKQEMVRDIALVSGIPPSYFNLDTMDFPSGEALRKIEARFTSLIQEAQRSFGETWSELMSFALQIERITKTDIEIETQWTDAAPVGETEMLTNALLKLQLGWSVEQIQRDYGLSDKQIEMMMAENMEMQKQKTENAAKFFDAGNPIIE